MAFKWHEQEIFTPGIGTDASHFAKGGSLPITGHRKGHADKMESVISAIPWFEVNIDKIPPLISPK